ncbi:MAG: hypothetical protein IJY87_01040 [Bacilli bacterium]|nr:hypothetical protein [Bacilli bacterium]
MKVVNKKMCVIVILVLVIIESCTLFLMYKSYSAKETNLDEVNLNIDEKSNMFAIMIEQEDGTYKESSDNSWPTDGYTYNESMSGCIDINGNKLDGVLSYDATNNIATVDTGNTSYCYLYFSMKQNAGEYLLKNPPTSLNNTTLEAGMYRYQGTYDVVTNNYICFGTSVKSTCTGNTDAYMYRIIGIKENGQMKLIKKEALNSELQWWSDYETDVTWPNSLIYDAINGSSFLTNTTYVPNGWESKIATIDWKYGDPKLSGSVNDFDGPTTYALENSFTETTSAKIGLWYIYDYYYAYASGGVPGSYSNAKTAWIHLSHNDSFDQYASISEWTMSRYGNAGSVISPYCLGWMVHTNGYADSDVLLSDMHFVRPVFYLTEDVRLLGGTGTISDPFIIN